MAGARYYHQIDTEMKTRVEVCSDDIQQGLHIGVRYPELGRVCIATLTPKHARELIESLLDALAAIEARGGA